MAKSLEEKIGELQSQLEAISPNLKAVEHLKEVEERLLKTDDELNSVKEFASLRSSPSVFQFDLVGVV